MNRRHAALFALAAMFTLAACSDDTPPPPNFLDGTASDPGILLAVNQDKALFMLQTGAPDQRVSIPLGSSSTILPVAFSVQGDHAVVPLGNAASIAYVNLATETVERFFTFPSGNATGSAWVNATTAIACNQLTDICGRITTTQALDDITVNVSVTQFPNSVLVTGGRVFVVSSNLDDSYMPAGPGVVSEINPSSMTVVRTFEVGTNPQYAAVAPNGKLYVVNTGDYGSNNGTLSVINLSTNEVEATLPGFGDAPITISIDSQGRAFISSFSYGTIAWDTNTGTFIRDPAHPLCAPVTGGACRGASDATVAPNGKLYQGYFGNAAASDPAYYFVYDGSTLALTDSIVVPIGPIGMVGATF